MSSGNASSASATRSSNGRCRPRAAAARRRAPTGMAASLAAAAPMGTFLCYRAWNADSSPSRSLSRWIPGDRLHYLDWGGPTTDREPLPPLLLIHGLAVDRLGMGTDCPPAAFRHPGAGARPARPRPVRLAALRLRPRVARLRRADRADRRTATARTSTGRPPSSRGTAWARWSRRRWPTLRPRLDRGRWRSSRAAGRTWPRRRA